MREGIHSGETRGWATGDAERGNQHRGPRKRGEQRRSARWPVARRRGKGRRGPPRGFPHTHLRGVLQSHPGEHGVAVWGRVSGARNGNPRASGTELIPHCMAREAPDVAVHGVEDNVDADRARRRCGGGSDEGRGASAAGAVMEVAAVRGQREREALALAGKATAALAGR